MPTGKHRCSYTDLAYAVTTMSRTTADRALPVIGSRSRSVPGVSRAGRELPTGFRVFGAEGQGQKAAQRGRSSAELRQRVGRTQLLTADAIVSGGFVERYGKVARDEQARAAYGDP